MFKKQDLNESDRKIMERGARRCAAVIVFALLFAIFSSLISGCQRNEKQPVVYRVESSEIVWETSPENNRQKVPVVKDVAYLIVGEE